MLDFNPMMFPTEAIEAMKNFSESYSHATKLPTSRWTVLEPLVPLVKSPIPVVRDFGLCIIHHGKNVKAVTSRCDAKQERCEGMSRKIRLHRVPSGSLRTPRLSSWTIGERDLLPT